MEEKIKSCDTCRYAKQNYSSVIGVIPWCCEKHWHCKPGRIAGDYMPRLAKQSVLISITPKWCALIASGKKTVEVRKTRPKLETPFRCYIYCTHGYYRTPKEREKSGDFWVGKPINDVSPGRYWGNGKVIGEFVCEYIDRMTHCGTNNNDIKLMFVDSYCYTEIAKEYLYKCQLSYFDLEKYANGGNIYGWHISDLKIYDEPQRVTKFWHFGVKRGAKVTRPPQSWCYVDGLE